MGGGCLAGTNYARVTPNGDLTPCPYMPLSAGNIRDTSFVDLWEKSEHFQFVPLPPPEGQMRRLRIQRDLRRLPGAPLRGSRGLDG